MYNSFLPILALLGSLKVQAYPATIERRFQVFCTPATWETILTFFLINYVTHAMTVKSVPGQRLQPTIRLIVSAFLIPFSAIGRACDMIRSGKVWGETDLQYAARAGALCAVVRNIDWEPLPGENIAGCRMQGLEFVPGRDTSVEGRLLFDDDVYSWRVHVSPETHHIHGSVTFPLPKGYSLALLKSKIAIKPRHGDDVKLSKSHSVLKWTASIVQLIFACIILYRSRGNQFNHYGYAAFGLTVIPYAIMSFLNLVANVVTPDFPCIYMVRSEVMDEAERRGSGFDGTVGSIDPGQERNGQHTFHIEGVTRAGVSQREVSVRVSVPDNMSPPDKDSLEDNIWDGRRPGILVRSYGRYAEVTKSIWVYAFRIIGFFLEFLAYITPYLIINALTGFRAGQSTASQRGWTMAWLVFGQAYSFVEDIIPRRVREFVGLATPLRSTGVNKTIIRQILFWVSFVILYGAPALGGMVTVGRMIKEFGSCVVAD